MKKVSSEKLVQDIRRRTRKKYSSEEKIRIVLEGMRGEENISELCRRRYSIQPVLPLEQRFSGSR